MSNQTAAMIIAVLAYVKFWVARFTMPLQSGANSETYWIAQWSDRVCRRKGTDWPCRGLRSFRSKGRALRGVLCSGEGREKRGEYYRDLINGGPSWTRTSDQGIMRPIAATSDNTRQNVLAYKSDSYGISVLGSFVRIRHFLRVTPPLLPHGSPFIFPENTHTLTHKSGALLLELPGT